MLFIVISESVIKSLFFFKNQYEDVTLESEKMQRAFVELMNLWK